VMVPMTSQSFGNSRVNCRQSAARSICMVGGMGAGIRRRRRLADFSGAI
jgi:hypothetical protein